MAAKNTSKPAAKDESTSQKKSASSATKAKAPTKASKPEPPKNDKPETEPKKAATKSPQPSSQKTATKTQTMAVKQTEPQESAPQEGTPQEAPEAAKAPEATKAPKKSAGSQGAKKVTVKFPKGIFSPATGTASSEPFSAKELDKFRVLIQDLRMENQDELEVLTDQLREMTSSENTDDNNAYSLHMAEQGTDAMEREKTFLQAQRTNDYIKKLDESLRRIQEGSFGICRICGLRLDSKRLMAVPVTQVCTVYKNTSKPCEPGKIQMEALGITGEENDQ